MVYGNSALLISTANETLAPYLGLFLYFRDFQSCNWWSFDAVRNVSVGKIYFLKWSWSLQELMEFSRSWRIKQVLFKNKTKRS